MKRMSRADLREWIPGEALERVDFGDGVTGMDKKLPSEHGPVGDLKRLMWQCAAVKADGGPDIRVLMAEYRIEGVLQRGYFDVVAGSSTSGPYTFDAAWVYINGVAAGYLMDSRNHPRGLYTTLRMLLNSMSGSSAQRQRNSMGPGPLTYSMVSVGSKSSGTLVITRKAYGDPLTSDTDSTCTRLGPVIRTRRMEPVTHSASENGGLSYSARCMSVCSRRLSACVCKAFTCLVSRSMSFLRSASRRLALPCSVIHPTTVTTSVTRNIASSIQCAANQFIMNPIVSDWEGGE